MEQSCTQVVELVVNVDDTTPEIIGSAMSELLDRGALDVWTTPITMKKNRPAVMLSVLCRQEDRESMTMHVVRLTGSFGVRYRSWDRFVLDRRTETIHTDLGSVRIKIGSHNGDVMVVKPEHEDVRGLAASNNMTVREVNEIVRIAAHAYANGHGDHLA